MVFNWRDYYTLAQALAKYKSRESALRSAVSRAYYAAFCIARNKALSQGLEIERSENVHEKIIRYYRSNPATVWVGNQLDRLRNNRNRCDYDNEISQPIKLSTSSLELSKRILDFFP